jgi:hypothetical protein
MNKIHLTLLGGVALLMVASPSFAADKGAAASGSGHGASMGASAKAPDMHHRARPFVVRGNQGFHYGDHLNIYTLKSRGTQKSKGYLDTK